MKGGLSNTASQQLYVFTAFWCQKKILAILFIVRSNKKNVDA